MVFKIINSTLGLYLVLKGCLVNVRSHGTRDNALIRFIRGIGDGYLRIQ